MAVFIFYFLSDLRAFGDCVVNTQGEMAGFATGGKHPFFASPFAPVSFGQIDGKNIFVTDRIRKIHGFAQSRQNRSFSDLGSKVNLHFNQFIAPFGFICRQNLAGAQTPPNQKSLGENLKELAEISARSSGQEDLDVEAGLEKVKTAAALIKSSKDKLDKLENEFKEIEKDFSVSPEDSVQQ